MPKVVLFLTVLLAFLAPTGAAAQVPLPIEVPEPVGELLGQEQQQAGQGQQQAAQAGELVVSNSRPAPGETITVEGNCGQNNSDQTVNLELDGQGLQQNASTDEQGRFTAQVTIPQDQRDGPATLTAICTGDGSELTAQLEIGRQQRAAVPARRIETGAGGAAADGVTASVPLLASGVAMAVAGAFFLALRARRS